MNLIIKDVYKDHKEKVIRFYAVLLRNDSFISRE